MNKLVVGNILYRPVRSTISVLAVAIEVIMILSIVAIMVGMVKGAAQQTSGIGADIIVQPPGASFISAVGGAPVPAKVATVLGKMPHVAIASPVAIQLNVTKSVQSIYGIDYESYNALRPFNFVSGGPFTGPYSAIVDDLYARANHTQVGSMLKIMNHDFQVTGIVEHGKGSRVFAPIATVSALMGSPGNATIFYLRSDDPKNQQAIIDEIQNTQTLSTYKVQTLSDWMSLMTPEHLPGFNIALRVVIFIAVIVGFLVIFQSMYTAVMERTREIGILKSLGASKLYIMNLVLREAVLVAIVGIVVGIGLTEVLRVAVGAKFPTIPFLVDNSLRAEGAAIALVGSVLGALYPAWKAASKDPIDALAYE
ncbi:MAG TPA: FtsX-like permease family protein [Acidobacteriaceae bacterium]|nr:FtsX-like permease family protein [Acidobacteriaceae bacterium]